MASDDSYPPGFNSIEIIAHLEGQLARERYELEMVRRRIRELETENDDLRKRCNQILQGKLLLTQANEPGQPVMSASNRRTRNTKLKRQRQQLRKILDGLLKPSNQQQQQNGQASKANKEKLIKLSPTQFGDQLKSLRSELASVVDDVREMSDEFYEHLKALRHCCRLHLEPAFLFENLIPPSAKASGFVLVRKSDLTNLLCAVNENVGAIATNLAEAASSRECNVA